MSESQIEFDFPLSYPENQEDIMELLNNCQDSGLEEDTDPQSVATVRFIQGTQLLLNGDVLLAMGQFERALDSFQSATNGLLAIANDLGEQLGPKSSYELTRRITFSRGKELEATARQMRETESPSDAENALIEAIQQYSSEMELEKEVNDFPHMLLSFRTVQFLMSLLESTQAEIEDDLIRVRDHHYRSLTNLKKARLLGAEIAEEHLAEILTKINKCSLGILESSAESLWNIGNTLGTKEAFDESAKFFLRGAEIFKEMVKIERRPDYELQEKIYRASSNESRAKQLMAEDRHREAAEALSKATMLLEAVVKIVQQLGNQELVESFDLQKTYFSALTEFCLGIVQYDNLEDDAEALFESAKNSLEQTLEVSKKTGNDPLVIGCEKALNQISSYLEMMKLMTE